MNRIPQIKLFSQLRQVVGVSAHVIAIPGLRGTAVAATVVRNDPVSLLTEKQHLRIPVVCTERPAVAEHDRLPMTPVFVEDSHSILCCDCSGSHDKFSLSVPEVSCLWLVPGAACLLSPCIVRATSRTGLARSSVICSHSWPAPDSGRRSEAGECASTACVRSSRQPAAPAARSLASEASS